VTPKKHCFGTLCGGRLLPVSAFAPRQYKSGHQGLKSKCRACDAHAANLRQLARRTTSEGYASYIQARRRQDAQRRAQHRKALQATKIGIIRILTRWHAQGVSWAQIAYLLGTNVQLLNRWRFTSALPRTPVLRRIEARVHELVMAGGPMANRDEWAGVTSRSRGYTKRVAQASARVEYERST
jgi:hypothetical protein